MCRKRSIIMSPDTFLQPGGIQIRQGTEADVEQSAEILCLARADNPFDWACYPKCFTEMEQSSPLERQREMQKLKQNRMQNILQQAYPRSMRRFLVATRNLQCNDGIEEHAQTTSFSRLPLAVGFATWEVLPFGTSEAEWQSEHSKRHNLPAWDAFDVEIKPVFKAIVGVDAPHIRKTSIFPQS